VPGVRDVRDESVPERQGPKSVNADDAIVRIPKFSFKAAGNRIKREDFATAELADYELVTEAAGKNKTNAETILSARSHKEAGSTWFVFFMQGFSQR
jgi:hypothetical protein